MKITTTKVAAPIAELILAHGAGAGKHSPFMQDMAKGLGQKGVQVSLFDFPYMEKAQLLGKRQPPNRMPVLQQDFLEVIASRRQQSDLPFFIGGKSMGGRVATLIAEQSQAMGIVCYGYPFHPPGKADKLRTEHLYTSKTPTLIVQGERDTFGNRQEVLDYQLPQSIELAFLQSADHSFKPLKSSGLTLTEHLHSAMDLTVTFIKEQL